MNMKRIIALILSLCTLLGCLSGCGHAGETAGTDTPAPDSSTPQSPAGEPVSAGHVDVLRIGTTYGSENYSIFSQADAFGRMNYNSFVAMTFWAFDENGELSPAGCFFRSWDISEDDRALTLHYDLEGLNWHDGQPVTDDDVTFTFEFWRDQNYPLFLHFESIELVESGTVRLSFDQPMAFSFMNQATMMYCMMPKHIWEGVETPAEYGADDAAVGCGPYRLVSKDADAQVSYYEAVEDFPRGELTVDRVELHSYDTQSSLIQAMLSGEIDVMYGYSASLDTTLLPLIEGSSDIDAGRSINTATYQITFGFNQYPTNDLAFRQAVRYALDYDILNDTITGGYGSPSSLGAVSPSCLGYVDSLGSNARDLDAAAKVLDEAGYLDVDGDGLRELPDGSRMNVKIALQSGSDLYKRIAEVIQINLADAGIRVSVDEQTVSNSDYTATLRRDGSYEIYLGMTTVGIAFWTGIASYIADVVITSGQHFGTYADADYMAAYTAMTEATDYEEYIEAFRVIQQLNAEDAPAVALANMITFYPYRTDRITGWTNYPAWGVINPSTWYTAVSK